MKRRAGLGARCAATGAAFAAFAAVVVVAATGCGAPDAVVARVMEAGPPAVEAGTLCTDNSQCGSQEVVDGGPPPMFCSMDSCSAKTGTCQPRETVCDPSVLPVCGCSGVFYWNDCLRKAHGEPASQQTGCPGPPRTCSFSADGGTCPEGAYCEQLYDPSCQPLSDGRPSVGVCLVLPTDCPEGTAVGSISLTPSLTPTAVSCKNNTCMGLCSALLLDAPITSLSLGCR